MSSSSFIQSPNNACQGRQGSNHFGQRLLAASSNTSNVILKTKEKTFALSPEDKEVGAILKVCNTTVYVSALLPPYIIPLSI